MAEPTIADLMAAKEAANGPIPPGFKRKTWFAIKSGNWIPPDGHPVWFKLIDCWRDGYWIPPHNHPLRGGYEATMRYYRRETERPTRRVNWYAMALIAFIFGMTIWGTVGHEATLQMPQGCLVGLSKAQQPGCTQWGSSKER